MQKDASKSAAAPSAKVQSTANGIDYSSAENIKRENNTELTNGYSNVNNHEEKLQQEMQPRERGRQRTKKDDNRSNEFLNQIATTMQHLQRDLDRVTTRVRNLEGQALQALAPQKVRTSFLIFILNLNAYIYVSNFNFVCLKCLFKMLVDVMLYFTCNNWVIILKLLQILSIFKDGSASSLGM